MQRGVVRRSKFSICNVSLGASHHESECRKLITYGIMRLTQI